MRVDVLPLTPSVSERLAIGTLGVQILRRNIQRDQIAAWVASIATARPTIRRRFGLASPDGTTKLATVPN